MAFGKKKELDKAPKVVTLAPASDLQKFEALFKLGTALDKKYETTGSLMRLGAKNIITLPHISTKLPTFDYDVMGIGGVPSGRIVEVFGPESAGKTTWTLWTIAQAQAQGKLAAFVDAEHALDPGYAKHLGVNVDDLLISQPDHGDQALDIVRELVKSACVGLIVVDSVAALTPEAELLGEIGDTHVGLLPRMMAQALRILTAEADKNKVTVVFINQIRDKIGTMYGNPETTPGGRALKHYASVRIDVRRQEPIKVGEILVGHKMRLKAVKNKVGTPLRETVVDLYYPGTDFECGFDYIGDTIQYASKRGLFEMSGSWYNLDMGNKGGPERLANGLANLKTFLKSNPEILAFVQSKVAKLIEAETKVTL